MNPFDSVENIDYLRAQKDRFVPQMVLDNMNEQQKMFYFGFNKMTEHQKHPLMKVQKEPKPKEPKLKEPKPKKPKEPKPKTPQKPKEPKPTTPKDPKPKTPKEPKPKTPKEPKTSKEPKEKIKSFKLNQIAAGYILCAANAARREAFENNP